MDSSSNNYVELPDKLKAVVTPMSKEVWATELAGHPDRTLAKTIMQGVAEGSKTSRAWQRALSQ